MISFGWLGFNGDSSIQSIGAFKISIQIAPSDSLNNGGARLVCDAFTSQHAAEVYSSIKITTITFLHLKKKAFKVVETLHVSSETNSAEKELINNLCAGSNELEQKLANYQSFCGHPHGMCKSPVRLKNPKRLQ